MANYDDANPLVRILPCKGDRGVNTGATVVTSAADMKDKTKAYLYAGTTGGGYTKGNWYYYNGSAWTSGGAYNLAVVDDELDDDSENAVQNKVIVEELEGIEARIAEVENELYAGRDRDKNTLDATTKFTPASSFFDTTTDSDGNMVPNGNIMNMPNESWMIIAGSNFNKIVNPGFPYKALVTANTPVIVTRSYVHSNNYSVWQVFGKAGNMHLWGYTGDSSQTTVTWKDITNLRNEPQTWETGMTLLNMPAESWFILSRDDVIDIVNALPWKKELPTGTYLLKREYTKKMGDLSIWILYSWLGKCAFWGYNLAIDDTPYQTVHWNVLYWDENYIPDTIPLYDNEVEIYSNFSFEDADIGWYTMAGSVVGNVSTARHSKLIEVKPNTKYYISYLHKMNQNYYCALAFFDRHGSFVSGLNARYEDPENPGSWVIGDNDSGVIPVAITPSYTSPQPNNTYRPPQDSQDSPDDTYFPVSRFRTFYSFTTPKNAHYISANLGSRYIDILCISSIPHFYVGNTINTVIKRDDPIFADTRNKKLCIIGPSTVMMDRYKPDTSVLIYSMDGHGNRTSADMENNFNVGFQEYLAPFYKDTVSLGYSAAAMSKGLGPVTGKCSIYTRICGGQESFTYNGENRTYNITAKDLSDYDDFLITPSSNGFSSFSVIGTFENDREDPTTYVGATYLICKKILQDNSFARIFIRSFTENIGTNLSLRIQADRQIFAVAQNLGCKYIDFSLGNTINSFNFPSKYSYDGKHYNWAGNHVHGQRLLRDIVYDGGSDYGTDSLFQYNAISLASGISTKYESKNNLTFTWNDDVCTINGTASTLTIHILIDIAVIPTVLSAGDILMVDLGEPYPSNSLSLRVMFMTADGTILSTNVLTESGKVTVPEGATHWTVGFRVTSGTTINNLSVQKPDIVSCKTNATLTKDVETLMQRVSALEQS